MQNQKEFSLCLRLKFKETYSKLILDKNIFDRFNSTFFC